MTSDPRKGAFVPFISFPSLNKSSDKKIERLLMKFINSMLSILANCTLIEYQALIEELEERNSQRDDLLYNIKVYCWSSLADPGFGQGGGPRNFVRDFADVAKQSQASKASQYWPGSRARLRALEALAFLTVKYAFSHFPWYFFFKFLL